MHSADRSRRVEIFNLNPATYDLYRPGYPHALFMQAVSYANLQPDSRVLEIGIGTGQATEPYLYSGYSVTALEPGDRLAEFARQKYRDFPSLRVITTPFEHVETDDRFDLVIAGTAFHWVNADTGLEKIRTLLKPGGEVALFWNRPKPQDPVHAAMQDAYRTWRPDGTAEKPNPFGPAQPASIDEQLMRAGFMDVQSYDYARTRVLPTDDYLGLLGTYSDHSAMAFDAREGLERDLRTIINAHGGQVEIHDAIDLHLGRNQ